jgi:hypothetical protein
VFDTGVFLAVLTEFAVARDEQGAVFQIELTPIRSALWRGQTILLFALRLPNRLYCAAFRENCPILC